MERFVIIVNGSQPLTIVTKRFILDVAAALDPPLLFINTFSTNSNKLSKFDAGNVILFEIKVFGRDTKKTMLSIKNQ